ncbi:tyrosine-type recombinase/integrase [Streptomyces sp. NPDC102259]|uniref:tyrosine-type recombinase/integrase n=1 Tax=Streptomyces sp. NPDC102259 TaxID=3366148 RepID=UPI0037F72718
MTEIMERSALAPEIRTAGPRPLSEAARAALEAGTADNTRRGYSSDWAAFTVWCAATGERPLPATAETLVEYVTYLAATPSARTGRPLAPSSIRRALTSIRAAHRAAGVTPPEVIGARKVLSGHLDKLAKAKDPAARPRKAAPATPRELRAMLADVDRTTLKGKRDAALLLLGFATAARVSELSSLDVSSATETEHGYDVHVYRHKVREWTDAPVMYGTDPATCPVRALRAYLVALAEAGRTEGPLFVRIDRHGRVAPPMMRRGQIIGDPTGRMTGEAIGDLVATLADRCDLKGEWSGHSLRRGFATAAYAAGSDLLSIARAGGWGDGSRTLAGYVQTIDRVKNSPLIGIGL